MANPVNLTSAPVALQGVTAPGYNAIDLRRLAASSPLQEGVRGVTSVNDFKVSPGAGLTVNVACAGAEAFVQGDAVNQQGLYYCREASSTLTVDVPANASGSPRLDMVVLEILDNQHDGTGSNLARLRVVAGTPNAGATLGTRAGAAAPVSSALLIADVLTPAGSPSTIPAANIRDRRPWSQGARQTIIRNSGPITDNYGMGTSPLPFDAVNINPRLECSGRIIVAKLIGVAAIAAGLAQRFTVRVDGAEINVTSSGGFGDTRQLYNMTASSTIDLGFNWMWEFTPAPGSHLIAPYLWQTSGGAPAIIYARADIPLIFSVEEKVGPITSNA